MKSFSKGLPWEKKYIESIVESYSDEWKKGYLTSGFSVFNKKGQFMGNVTIEKVEGIERPKKGEIAELYYLFKPEYWGQGYATEAVSAVMNSYLPIAINRGYKFDNIPLRELFATVRLDNLYSKKLLDNIGLSTTSIISKFDAERYYCNTYAKQIVNRYYHYYQLKKESLVERLLNQNLDESDITIDEMVASAFGRASNTAKKARGVSY
jgi:RimJ/RimL family protein N-acetyltransferase